MLPVKDNDASTQNGGKLADELVLISRVAANDENNVTASLHDITSATSAMTSILGQVQVALGICGDDATKQCWQDLNHSLRKVLTASRLAASSMTVFLSEYTNVILNSVITGQVPIPALQAEINTLMKSIERRHAELIPPDNLDTMQNFCANLARIIVDTRSYIKAPSTKVTEKERNNVVGLLDQLDAQLNRWTTKRTKADSALLEKLNSGLFVCALAAVLFNPKAVHNTLIQIQMGDPANTAVLSPVDRKDHRNEMQETLIGSQGFDVLEALDKLEQASPEYARKIDSISDVYHLLPLELKSLQIKLTSEPESVVRNEAFVKQISVVQGLYTGLIKAMDLYSKQPLLTQHTTTSHTTPVAKKRASLSSFNCIPNASCMSRTFS